MVGVFFLGVAAVAAVVILVLTVWAWMDERRQSDREIRRAYLQGFRDCKDVIEAYRKDTMDDFSIY